MFRKFLDSLADIIYPKTCLVCKTNLKNKPTVDDIVCTDCWMKTKRNLPPFCFRCGRHLDRNNLTKNICPSCIRKPLYFDRAFSPYIYEGVIKELIHAFKYKGKDYLARTLSKAMIEFIKEYTIPLDFIDLIVPMPLHNARLRERDFNQAKILSDYIAKEFNKTISDTILVRKRNTVTQTDLEPAERLKNVKDCFSVNYKVNLNLKEKNILLIDDVLTTGATASEAALTLKSAGANTVFVLTLAS